MNGRKWKSYILRVWGLIQLMVCVGEFCASPRGLVGNLCDRIFTPVLVLWDDLPWPPTFGR